MKQTLIQKCFFALGLFLAFSGTAQAQEEHESVDVKYHGAVSLENFDCFALKPSSLVKRVCYHHANSHLLVNLQGTFYHYCAVPDDLVFAFVNADSLGSFYRDKIKGQNHDCRMHGLPLAVKSQGSIAINEKRITVFFAIGREKALGIRDKFEMTLLEKRNDTEARKVARLGANQFAYLAAAHDALCLDTRMPLQASGGFSEADALRIVVDCGLSGRSKAAAIITYVTENSVTRKCYSAARMHELEIMIPSSVLFGDEDPSLELLDLDKLKVCQTS